MKERDSGDESHYYSPNVGKEAYHRAYVDYVSTGELESEAPTVPGNVTADAENDSAVRIDWAPSQDNRGVVGYRVYRDDVLLTTSLVAPLYYVDRTAEAETSYTYQVSAVDAAGNESARSADVVATTPPFRVNLAAGKPYTASVPAHSNYPDTGGSELTDGVRGSDTYADTAWQGRYLSEPYTLTVDLGSSQTLTEVSAGFLQDLPVGVMLPQGTAYYVSDDNVNFTKIGDVAKPVDVSGDSQTIEYKLKGLSGVTGRYVKIEVNSVGAWSFVDELEVR
ncbi:discoidin domain-containing protein [Paenibacillus sp. GCM10027626]|uniref:discoidin domain-containing protein n=1 Tax=Paenibacillus sp. GCM10027626 TaxID=3273411 RepID=UPI00363FB495